MRFNCGPTYEEKLAAKEKWRIWFAWYPVRIGSGDCRWLEHVKRKRTSWGWEYRKPEETA